MKADFEKLKNKKVPFSFWDFIVLGVVIALVVALLLVIFLPKQQPTTAKIYHEGKLIKSVTLSERESPLVFNFDGVTILIEKDVVSVIDSKCDDKCCMQLGKITHKGDCIVCVPKTITITLC